MAELILPWVNNLKLSKKVACIEKDFSNGSLFGEILVRLKQLDSTSDFVYANTPAARVNNFTLLEPTLRRLDIRLDTNKIQLIVEEQEGAALQLLYQIKAAISAHSKNCGRTLSDISRIITTEKPPYEAAQKRFLDERLRKLVWPAKNESPTTGETSLGGRSPRQGKAAPDLPVRQQQENIRSPQQPRRRSSREKHQNTRKEEAPERDGKDLLNKNTSPEAPWSSPGAKARVALTAKSPLSTKAREAQLSQEEVQKGIAHFEMNLQRLGLDAASSTAATMTAGDVFPTGHTPQNLEIELSKRLPSSTCCRENAKMMERLHGARAAQEVARKEREKRRQKLLMEQNQARAASAAFAVEEALIERTQRRSKRAAAIRYKLWKVKQYQAVIGENRTLREAQYVEKRLSHEVTERQRASHARTVVQECLCREVHLEAAQCRALKKQLQAAKRARLIEECQDIVDLIVDMIAAASLYTQEHDTAVIDSRTWRDWLIAFVEGVSALSATIKRSNGADTVKHFFADRSQSFLQLSGPSVTESMLLLHNSHGPAETCPPSMEVGSTGMEKRLSEDDFFVYLNGEGQWQGHTNIEEVAGGVALVDHSLKEVTTSEAFKEVLKSSEALYPAAVERLKTEVPTNPNGEPALHQLGSVVSSLFDLCHSEPPLAPPTDIPDCPLRIVITGKPFAGKYTLAKKLGERFKLHVINFADLVKEVLALQHDLLSYKVEERVSSTRESVSLPAVTPNSYVPSARMLELAAETQYVLSEGEKLSNKLCVDICVAKIQELFVPRALDNVKELLRHVPIKEQPELTNSHKSEKAGASTARKGQKGSANAKDKTPPAKESPDESAQQRLGWILVDFPQSYEQCVLLEERLSGYVTPDRLPTSEVSRKKAQASFVVPLPEHPHSSQVSIADECCYIEEEQKVAHLFLNQFGVSIERVVDRKRKEFAQEVVADSCTSANAGTDLSPEPTGEVNIFAVDAVASVTDESAEATPLSSVDLSAVDHSLHTPTVLTYRKMTSFRTRHLECSRPWPQHFTQPVPRTSTSYTCQKYCLTTEVIMITPISCAASLADNDWRVASPSKRPISAVREEEACPSANEADGPQGACEDPSSTLASIAALEHDVKTYLMAKWEALEEEYNATMMKLFGWIRQTRREFTRGLVDIQVHFSDLLQRPDAKQEIVEVFVVEYNSFVSNVGQSFHLDTIKAEMHLQVDELAESLWQQIDTRRKEAATEHKRLVETGWLEAVCLVLAAQLEALVEAELKRYLALEEFATDAYYNMLNACIPENKRTPVNSSAIKDAAQSAAKQAFAWLCNQKTSNHDSGVHKPWQTHIFEQLEAKAKEHLIPLTDFEEYTPATVEVEKKKASKTKLPIKEETKPREEPLLHVELQQTRLELQVQVLCRLRRLCVWGATRVHGVTKSGNEILGRLDDWIIARSLAEHAAVRELIMRIKYCIENEKQIPHAMTLSGKRHTPQSTAWM